MYLAPENKAWGKGFRPEKDLKFGEMKETVDGESCVVTSYGSDDAGFYPSAALPFLKFVVLT